MSTASPPARLVNARNLFWFRHTGVMSGRTAMEDHTFDPRVRRSVNCRSPQPDADPCGSQIERVRMAVATITVQYSLNLRFLPSRPLPMPPRGQVRSLGKKRSGLRGPKPRSPPPSLVSGCSPCLGPRRAKIFQGSLVSKGRGKAVRSGGAINLTS